MPSPKLHVDAAVTEIITALQNGGWEAYVVGGAVRDLLLGITPKDYDIATSATPEEVKNVFGRRARIIGKRFRLVHVYHGRTYYEVSTFRREPTAEERRGRETDDGMVIWRDNQYGTLEQDAQRRDFTVNAIYYDPVGDRGIMDWCGGVDDLEAGIVRAIGNPELRILEDPVRILRALKLVGQYGFAPEPELEKALREQANHINTGSRSRLYEELLKIFAKPCAAATFKAFHDYGLLAHYLPAFESIWNEDQGRLTMELLAERDRRSTQPGYSRSRTLAFATLTAASVADVLGVSLRRAVWPAEHGIEPAVQQTIRAFFEPLPLPKVLAARTRDVMFLLPWFTSTEHRNRLLSHSEYRYARELFSLLTTVCDWNPDLLAEWPETGSGRGGRRRRRPPSKHVRRSHRKHWEKP